MNKVAQPAPVFHFKDNIFFARYGDGSVHMACFREPPTDVQAFYILGLEGGYTGPQPYFQITINADGWASIVASVSRAGEANGRFYEAKRFHQSEQSTASRMKDVIIKRVREAEKFYKQSLANPIKESHKDKWAYMAAAASAIAGELEAVELSQLPEGKSE